ncbi:MAG: NRDE family protein [Chitinophagales bacterium]|nr:NRDE family protein [Chitinophagales bacterium]
MCTVSFIPVKDKFFLTSNRDEKYTRQKAIIPELITYKGSNIIFPRDADHGGTWIGLKENGDMGVLLNGAFLRHTASPPYRKSRGIIFLDVLATERPSVNFSKTDLTGIEPFTFILYEKNCLYEFRWNGIERYRRQLAANRPHIWSSVTLYDGTITRKREQWFAGFLNRNPNPTQTDILNFHRFSGDGDKRNDLLMSRDDVYSTVSISSILLTADRGSMKYIDLTTGKQAEIKIELTGLANFL